MNPEVALLGACREWRRLAEAETKAICRRDWKFFFECHQALQLLQPLITRLRKDAAEEWKRQGNNLSEKENNFRAVVSDLMEIGRNNRAMLQSRLETVRLQLHQLGRDAHNLRRLRKSYAGVS